VADGYARNFLLPRKLAVSADSASATQIEHDMGIIKVREEKKRANLREYAKQLDKVTVEIKARAGEEDKLFGSVTAAQIADGLKELGHTIDRKNLQLADPIKTLGIFTVPVKLGLGVTAEIKVWVTNAQPAPEPEETAEAEPATGAVESAAPGE